MYRCMLAELIMMEGTKSIHIYLEVSVNLNYNFENGTDVDCKCGTCTIGLRIVFYGYTCKAILFYMKQMLRRGKATPVIKIRLPTFIEA